MAHITKLGALTDELVTLITSTSAKTEPARFSIYRDSALRAIRHHNYARTNHFDVAAQLEGLEEKFRVYNEDPLADALRERLNTISNLDSKWTPEILHLLLNLSERPLDMNRLEDLDLLKRPEPDTGPPMLWADLINDPKDEYLWQNTDFDAESSISDDGFDEIPTDTSETDSNLQSSVIDVFSRRPQEYAVDAANSEGLQSLRDAQFWQKRKIFGGIELETVKKPITELQAVREVLFMLSGVPTSLFGSTTPDIFQPSKGYALKHTSHEAFFQCLSSLADQGSAVLILRTWMKRKQPIPLLQVLQCSISKRVAKFDNSLSDFQQGLVAPEADIVVSLLKVQTQVTGWVRPLIRLSNVISRLGTDPFVHTFRYLEMLYDETCTSQMAGDEEMFTFMGRIFLECFALYLQPIRIWMEQGELNQVNKTFFISEISGVIEPALVWESKYMIRQTRDGSLHTPKFLRAAANKIFMTGKSVVILKMLNKFHLLESTGKIVEPSLDFDSICDSSSLAPFSELFDRAFEAWTQSKHRHASFALRKILFDSCGLQDSLDAFSTTYFMAEGTMATIFTNSIFDKLDSLDDSWSDPFSLTELAQSTFGSLSRSSDRIRSFVPSLPRKYSQISQCRRSVRVLSSVEVKYLLPWPVQMILIPAMMFSYQRIFTFLFQIRRSSHILSRNRLVKDLVTHARNPDEQSLYYALRTRLLWFSQTLYYYLTSLVLEPRSQKMREDMANAVDVDTMIRVHSTYIKLATNQALLGTKLELIQTTILKVLDLGIKLQDAQTANLIVTRNTIDRQQEMLDLSMASLGLQNSPRTGSQLLGSKSKTVVGKEEDGFSTDEDDHNEVGVDLSRFDADRGRTFVEKLNMMKGDFDRLVNFVASGLKGVARAGDAEEAQSWELLGEMLEIGLKPGRTGHL